MPVIDFSQVSEPVPSGSYLVEVIKVEEKPSAKGGFNNFYWTLLITDGDCAGQTIRMITTAKPNSLFLLKETLVALGENPSKDFDFDQQAYIGRSMVVDVRTKTYEGRERPEVFHCHPAG